MVTRSTCSFETRSTVMAAARGAVMWGVVFGGALAGVVGCGSTAATPGIVAAAVDDATNETTPAAAEPKSTAHTEPKPPADETKRDRPADKGAEKGADKDKQADKDQGPAKDQPKPDARPAKESEPNVLEHPFPRRIEVPELPAGEGWINTAGPISLKQVRGKFVILDFWTYCCINCIHVLPELKKLEKAYPNQLVVIGVHSAKFETEKDIKNIQDAVLRYEIEHPVVVDSKHRIWNHIGVRSWPSFLMIDPEGNAIDFRNGEIKFDDFSKVLDKGIPYYRAKKTLDETPLRFELARHKLVRTPLNFPGKVLADEASGRLFIADGNYNRIVVATLAGKLIATIGSGKEGKEDGDFATASFDHPQGMFLRGETLYVADTENHLIRKVDLTGRRVTTIAGIGKQAQHPWPGIKLRGDDPSEGYDLPERFVGPPKETALNSPWDLWIHEQDLYIAMAGPHQIWKMTLDEKEIGPYAGNGREDIVDGPLLPKSPYGLGASSFAQPSGLASDGKWLYVADSEGSSIRAVPFDPKKEVETVVGTHWLEEGRLFHFGDKDGEKGEVLLQHALGVVYHGGLLYVADTYNNKIKVVDPVKKSALSIAGKADDSSIFDEPTGISYAAGKLYVADTNNHRIRTVDLKDKFKVATLDIEGLKSPNVEPAPSRPKLVGIPTVEVREAAVKAKDGKVRFQVELKLPTGWKLNPLAPLSYYVEVAGEAGPIDAAKLPASLQTVEKPAAEFAIDVPVTGGKEKVALKVLVNYYYCQDAESGLCKAGQIVFTPTIRIDEMGRGFVKLSHTIAE